ncbi:MAG: CheR family methyltransferase [Thermodesulfobacteriota bacterium]|nr:CheR family methyltransferase [Thermodesulfobacteriota bacterium]
MPLHLPHSSVFEVQMDDPDFRQLLNRFHLSWEGYRKVRKGVKKRLDRHMQQIGCRRFGQYLQAVNDSSALAHECRLLLTVSISRFFRDRRLWEVLETDILPRVFQENRKEVRAWSAGCALGQEVYTFKMVWQKVGQARGQGPRLRLWATDMNPDYLCRAQAGLYPRSSLKEVPEAFLNTCFRPLRGKQSFAIDDALKEEVVWEIRDLLAPPPATGFHLLFLRNNLLTYYKAEHKVPAFSRIAASITKGGYLMIGCHEGMPSDFEGDFTRRHRSGIWQKRGEGLGAAH